MGSNVDPSFFFNFYSVGPGLFKAQGYYRFQVTGMIEIFGRGGGRLKISIPGFWGVGKFGKYFFGWLDFIRGFLGTQNNDPCGTPLASAFKGKMLFDFLKISSF